MHSNILPCDRVSSDTVTQRHLFDTARPLKYIGTAQTKKCLARFPIFLQMVYTVPKYF